MATRTISPLGGPWGAKATWVEAEVPTKEDDVVATGLSGEVKIEEEANCKTADFTNYVSTLNWNKAVFWSVYGGLKFVAGMKFEPAATRNLRIRNESGTAAITCAGKALPKVLLENAGTKEFKDAFSGGEVELAGGTLNAEPAATAKVTNFLAKVGTTLKHAGVAWECAAASSTPFNIASATIEGTASVTYPASVSSRKINIGAYKLSAFTVIGAASSGQLTIEHSGGTIVTLSVHTTVVAALLLQGSKTLNVTTWNVFGTSGNKLSVKSTAGTATVSKSSGTVESDWLILENVTATGGATWYAGGNSEDKGGNTGWIFASPKAPSVENSAASSITAKAATLSAKINPGGSKTTYVLEYGPTTAYGTKVEGEAGAGEVATKVEKTISGLTPNLLYHFRFVATNANGTTQGADTFFSAGVDTESAATLRTDVASHLSWSKRLETTDSGRSTRLRHVAVKGIVDPRLVFGNPHATKSIRVRASLEITTGQYFPVHFAGEDANYEVIIAPETIVVSEPLGGLKIVEGTKFFSNTLIKPAEEGGSYYRGSWPVHVVPADETGQRCALGTTDYTKAENPGGGEQYGYGPAAIKGRLNSSVFRLVGAVGDSIGAGNADSTYVDTAKFAGEEKGFFTRRYGAVMPFLNFCIGGAVGYQYAPTALRNQILKDCSHIFWQFGVNDLADKPLSALQAGFIENWATFGGYGFAYATTITPHTESTDGFATTKNQTPFSARFGPDPCDRQTYNEWLRDGAPVDTSKSNEAVVKGTKGASIARCNVFNAEGKLSTVASGPAHPLTGGVVDLAAVVEIFDSTHGSHVWKVGYTEEGIHPNTAAHEAMANALPSLAVIEGAGSAAGSSSISAAGIRRRHGGASPAGNSFASDVGVRRRFGSGAASGTSNAIAAAIRRRSGGGEAIGNSFASDVGVRRRFGGGGASGASSVAAVGTRRYLGAATVSGLGIALLALRRLLTVPGHMRLEDEALMNVKIDAPVSSEES